MSRAALIYPHQLYADHPALVGVRHALLVEEPLLFNQYHFHRQKLLLHRASMRHYADELERQEFKVQFVEAQELADTAAIVNVLAQLKITAVQYVDPCDDWLSTRLAAALSRKRIDATVLEDPHFLTPRSIIDEFTAGKERYFFTDFYIAQRIRLGLLLEKNQKPVGGKWSFDPENRRKLPKGLLIPEVPLLPKSAAVAEARQYVLTRFPKALGSDEAFAYPIDHASAALWLDTFVRERLDSFGDYEDAISTRHAVLFHSQLTPLLNTGLLTPRQVLAAVLAEAERIPINSLEGFLRQIIGWREFVRLVYLRDGRRQRTTNFWGFTHRLPDAFYDGSTGIDPVDLVIRRILETGYCHHIERLMILGNFMLLCEIHPDAVYQWFMELFIDAYDWVMVPNVYGMSQYADGGRMTTKPYISGSSYVMRMSDFRKGPWCVIWDALYWRFIDEHADVFAGNQRMALMVKMRDKLGKKLTEHRRIADEFLEQLHG